MTNQESFLPQEPEYASLASRVLLHYEAGVWLADKIPLFVLSHDLVNGQIAEYDGLPLTKSDVARHEFRIPGSLVCEFEPQAASVLGVEESDRFVATYMPPQYMDEPGFEKNYMSPTCGFGNLSSQGETKLSCALGVQVKDYAYFQWDSCIRPYEDMYSISVEDLNALQAIVRRFDDFLIRMRKTGEYPDDPIQVLREEEIAKSAQMLAQQAEREARLASERRLSAVPVCGVEGSSTEWRVRMAFGDHDKTYSFVPKEEIQELRIAIASRLLECQTPLFVFDAELASKTSPAFHYATKARRTSVTALSVMARSSTENGPIFTFTIEKEVLLNDGMSRTEIESFIFNGKHYIRLLTVQNMASRRPITLQINEQDPISRPQYDVFKQLLAHIKPSNSTGG